VVSLQVETNFDNRLGLSNHLQVPSLFYNTIIRENDCWTDVITVNSNSISKFATASCAEKRPCKLGVVVHGPNEAPRWNTVPHSAPV
jgi:hypothetical protein